MIPLHKLALRKVARTVALVPQQLDVPFQFTVREVVEQGRTPYLGFLRGPMSEDRMAVDRALDLADVAGLQQRIFNELSGGERQRVKIALGLAQEPKLLLLDEPTQNLDIGRQVELIDLLHFLRAEGITIFASIHDLQLVEGNFSSVLLLSPEMPLMNGTPEEILKPSISGEGFQLSAAASSIYCSNECSSMRRGLDEHSEPVDHLQDCLCDRVAERAMACACACSSGCADQAAWKPWHA